MTDFLYLIPVVLAAAQRPQEGAEARGAQGQCDDLDGAAERILFDDDIPLKVAGQKQPTDAAKSANASSSGLSARGPGADN